MRILTKYLESRPILKPAAEDIVFRCRFCPRPAASSVLYMMYYWSFSRFSPSWWTPLSLHYIPVSRAWVGSTRWAHRLPQINHRLSLAELFHNYLTRYSLTPPHNGAQCKHCLNIPSFSVQCFTHLRHGPHSTIHGQSQEAVVSFFFFVIFAGGWKTTKLCFAATSWYGV